MREGTRVGRYIVIGLVGRGGMNDVYAAYDPELNRKVALKFIQDDPDSRDRAAASRLRLLREAKAIAKLSHPNVVVVHDAGEIHDRVFIAMEFIDGETLAERLRGARRPWEALRDLFLAAGRGLAAAHAAGIVHRDFKPQNVMVGAKGDVKVMDFGLARDSDEPTAFAEPAGAPAPAASSNEAFCLTRTGMLIGTPGYMAPEQFRGEPADDRTDQFSFCVALYEALYGERPFVGDSLAALRVAVTTGAMREPPARTRVPLWLRRILLRGLHIDRAQRFPSMDALLRVLSRDPRRIRRRALAATGMALLLLGGGAVAQATFGQASRASCREGSEKIAASWEPLAAGARARPRRQMMEAAFLASGRPSAGDFWKKVSGLLDGYATAWRGAYRDACEAANVRHEQSAALLDLRMACLDERRASFKALTDVLVSADAGDVERAVDAVNALPSLERCADVNALREPAEGPRDPRVRARLDGLRQRAARAKALDDTGHHTQAVTAARETLAEAESLAYLPLVAELEIQIGTSTAVRDANANRRALEHALLAGLRARRDDLAAKAAAELAGLSGYWMNKREEGLRWADVADAILDRMGPGQERLRAWVLQNRAVIAVNAGGLGEALDLTRRALALKKRVLPADHPDLAISISTEAEILHEMGRNAEALALCEQALEIRRANYVADSPFVLTSLSNKGEYLVALGRAEEALPLFKEVLKPRDPSVSPGHPSAAYPLTGLGRALLALGRPAEARPYLEKALALRQVAGPDPLQRAETRFALAQALWATGERERARLMARQARDEYGASEFRAAAADAVRSWLAAHDETPSRVRSAHELLATSRL